MNRLKSVAHIGKSAGNDYRHGIVKEGFFHFLFYVHINKLGMGHIVRQVKLRQFFVFVYVFFVQNGFLRSIILKLRLGRAGVILRLSVLLPLPAVQAPLFSFCFLQIRVLPLPPGPLRQLLFLRQGVLLLQCARCNNP